VVCVYLEASKKILHYLASCSGHAGDVDRVKERLLQSNPVLEVCACMCVLMCVDVCKGRMNLDMIMI